MPRSVLALACLALGTALATGTSVAADPGGAITVPGAGGPVTFLPLPMTVGDRSVRDLAFGASELALDEAGGTGPWAGAFYNGGVFTDTDPRPDTYEQGAGIAVGYGFGGGLGAYLSLGQARATIDEDNGDAVTSTTLIGLTYADTLGGWDASAALYAGQSSTEISDGAIGDADYTGAITGLTLRARTEFRQLSNARALDFVVQGDIAEVTAEGYDVDDLGAEIDARSSTAMAIRFELGMPRAHSFGVVRPFLGFTKWGGQQGDVEASGFGGSTSFRAADLYGTHQGTLGVSFDLAETGLTGYARYSIDSNQDNLLNLSLGLAF